METPLRPLLSAEIEFKVASADVNEDGTFKAVFGNIGTVDKVGDRILEGAVKSGQQVAIVWHHQWSEPVGRGVITIEGKDLVVTGKFFLETIAGKEAYLTVKAMGDLQEWSFGYRATKATWSEEEDEAGHDCWIREIAEMTVYEVSPVLIGAGTNTGTLSVKSMKFVDHLTTVRAAVVEVKARTTSLAALRAQEERRIGDEGQKALSELRDEMAAFVAFYDDLNAATEGKVLQPAIDAELLHFQQLLCDFAE